jgi:predicted nuclease of predicted toxin-antitoxin system
LSIKVVIDMNLSPEWAGLLSEMGWPAVHWSSVGNANAPDAAIMEWAATNSHVVFTHDLDFGASLALTRATSPSVLQIRGRRVLPEEVGDLIAEVLEKYSDELRTGALVVVDETKSRVRILPF